MRCSTFTTFLFLLVLMMVACKADVLVGERRFDAAAVDTDADGDDDSEADLDADGDDDSEADLDADDAMDAEQP